MITKLIDVAWAAKEFEKIGMRAITPPVLIRYTTVSHSFSSPPLPLLNLVCPKRYMSSKVFNISVVR